MDDDFFNEILNNKPLNETQIQDYESMLKLLEHEMTETIHIPEPYLQNDYNIVVNSVTGVADTITNVKMYLFPHCNSLTH